MCDNYEAVTLRCTTHKILVNILFVKLGPYAEEITGEYQRGSQRGISNVDQIFTETNIGKILGTEYRRTSTIY